MVGQLFSSVQVNCPQIRNQGEGAAAVCGEIVVRRAGQLLTIVNGKVVTTARVGPGILVCVYGGSKCVHQKCMSWVG